MNTRNQEWLREWTALNRESRPRPRLRERRTRFRYTGRAETLALPHIHPVRAVHVEGIIDAEDHKGRRGVAWIDVEVADACEMLCRKGYMTENACAGHSGCGYAHPYCNKEVFDGYVTFEKKVPLSVSLPKGFTIDIDKPGWNTAGRVVRWRVYSARDLRQRQKELLRWATALPARKK